MAQLVRNIYNSFNYYVFEARDPRLYGYFLLGPIEMVIITSLYIYFVKHLGPQIMKYRKPFKLKRTIIVYNTLQVVLNSILFTLAVHMMIVRKHSIACQPVDYSWTASAIYEAQLTYFYYILKVLDLMDTVFFVLRKKQNQITFLHFYHHLLVYTFTNILCAYMPAGQITFQGTLNSLVHACMYLYYLIASFGLHQSSKSLIWWKKNLTHLQMVQFILVSGQMAYSLVRGNCSYPKVVTVFILSQNVLMFILFGNFYYKTYIKKSSKSAMKK